MRDHTPPPEEWEGSVLALQRRRRLLPRIALAAAALLTAETALVVATSGQAVALPAKKAQAPARPESGKGPRSAADIPSARVAARLSGRRVEALSERTETSTTWVNKDGSLTTELSAGPVRFQRDGEWTDVDVDLVRRPDGSVGAAAHPAGLSLAGKGGALPKSLAAAEKAPARDLVTLGEGDEQITLRWKGGLPAPKLEGTRATYAGALPDADLVVEATRTGFEQFVEINKRPATKEYSYTLPLKTDGLKVKEQRDGSLLFTDAASGKKKRAVMPAPVMWDAAVDEVSGEHTNRAKVDWKVVRTGDGVDLVITPDADFLADPDTRYPVTVDPSTSALSNVFDTLVKRGETTDWSTNTELHLGNPGTTNPDGTTRLSRSFITWNTAPISDALVSSAKLSLWNLHSGNSDCKPYQWTIWETGAPSTATRWDNQPSWAAQRHSSTETKGRAACGKAGSTSTVGEGMLLKATRPGLKQGTAGTVEGTAATSFVYDVPLTGSAVAPYNMGANDVRTWGQLDAPTDATAVFPADAAPASHTGSALTPAAYRRAQVHYLGVSGREVNSAAPGGHISTTEYDRFANTVRELSAANRAVALGLTAGTGPPRPIWASPSSPRPSVPTCWRRSRSTTTPAPGSWRSSGRCGVWI
ncbi:hypothetical protein GCM10023079_29620 [Streptomyces chitinivorans]